MHFFHVLRDLLWGQGPLKPHSRQTASLYFLLHFQRLPLIRISPQVPFSSIVKLFTFNTAETHITLFPRDLRNHNIRAFFVDPALTNLAFNPVFAVISGFKIHLLAVHTIEIVLISLKTGRAKLFAFSISMQVFGAKFICALPEGLAFFLVHCYLENESKVIIHQGLQKFKK